MTWDGSVVIWEKRILFAGEAGQSKTHDSHTILVCAAHGGTFDVQVGPPGGVPETYSAAIIEAGTQHSMDAGGTDFLALMYLLPETEAARELRRRYLGGGRVCRVPAEVAERLVPHLQEIKDIRDYWSLDCEKAGRFFDGMLGELIDTPPARRYKLDREVNPHVRRAIAELYSRMEDLLKGGPAGKQTFSADAIASSLGLGEVGWDGKVLKREFKRSTGASYEDYVKLLRFRATLVKLARNEQEMRGTAKTQGCDAEGADKESAAAPSDDDREKARRISLTEAARQLGWRELSDLVHASTDIIGISPNALRVDSRFVACGGD